METYLIEDYSTDNVFCKIKAEDKKQASELYVKRHKDAEPFRRYEVIVNGTKFSVYTYDYDKNGR